jgi:predicted metal-dependent hydrolase
LTRDRDPAGRPRNARPRDALGRPLPRTEANAGQTMIPDDLALTGPEAARLADRLLREGRPFHAHEVFEASWKSGPPDERDLWQGLAQIAVGLTHAHRGNARGAVTLLGRGTQRVRAYLDRAEPSPEGERGHPYGMDLAAFVATCEDLAARIERQGPAAIPAAALRPELIVPGP